MSEEGKNGQAPGGMEGGFRKLYWKFGLKVLAGVFVLALIDLLPLPSKWWSIPFLLVGAWLILANLTAMSILATAQHRYRHGPEDETPLRFQDSTERMVHVLSYVVLALAMLATTLLSGPAENIVEKGRFFLLVGGLGGTLAAFVTWWIKRTVPGYYQRNSESRGGAVLGLFLGIVFLTVLGSAWVDRRSAEANATVARYAVQSMGSNIKTGSNYVHLYRPGSKEERFRIQVRGTEMQGLVGRDSLDLRIGTGDLGFTHVLGVHRP
ncbi:MAG: hypothetical protein KF905_01600 [Flavobacteriales bacterium]|nr:hypothetical protein [Flavobacteriales bacterium]